MPNRTTFVPVKKVLSIINSCETEKQLNVTLKLIENYINQLASKGVVNPELVQKRLMKEYKQKLFQLSMIKFYVKSNEKEFKGKKIKNSLRLVS
jgi:hypothetical protein